MDLRRAFLLLIFFFPGVSVAQPGRTSSEVTLRDADQHRWEKAEARLRKSLSRESLNPSVRHALSRYFFRDDNPAYDLDSAYHYAVTAFEDYRGVSDKTKNRLKRTDLDSAALVALRVRIETAAFEVARSENTEAAYLSFLSHFPTAAQREDAEQLRNEVAYQTVLRSKTPEDFRRYILNYPHSKRAADAQKRYDRLLFEQATSDQSLQRYEAFLRDHPETPYREEIDRRIFEMSTISGGVASHLSFMGAYPANKFAETARNVAFHLLNEEEQPDWPDHFLSDSLRRVLQLNRYPLVPFLENGRFGFMDSHGATIIPPSYAQIHGDYLCGNVEGDVLIVEDRLVARDGTTICRGPISALADVGVGFLKVASGGKTMVVHKSGFIVADSLDDARVVLKRFLAVRRHDAWWLHALTGRLLDARPWHDIDAVHDLLLLSRNEKKFIARLEMVPDAEAAVIKLSDPFDEVKPWPGGLIWGRSGQFEGVLNDRLESFIGFDQHTLARNFFGATATLRSGFALYNREGKRSSIFEKVLILGKRAAVRRNGLWSFFDPVSQTLVGRTYDSLTSAGPFFLVVNDSVTIHFQNNSSRRFYKPKGIAFVPGMDSTSFLVVDTNGHDKSVFDVNGKKLFSAFFDTIESAGHGVFVVSRKNKKGLINGNGQQILTPEFDAIGSLKGGIVSVLKNRKFGTFDIEKRKLIRPLYDRNPVSYTQDVITAFRDGYYGLVGWDEKPLSAFDFNEVTYWSDSVALVRKGSAWSLYHIVTGEDIERDLRSISVVKESPHEKIAIVQKGNDLGVLSSTGKVVIPMTFSDVINVGSSESPLYFTEKHVPEASIHVIIYYDAAGNMLRKDIYDDASEFDRIFCTDH